MTIGVTKVGPKIGICWSHASGAVCGMATTAGASAATSGASVVRLLVTGLATCLASGVAAESSRRDAAAKVHITGEAIGAVGASPDEKSNSALTMLDNATLAVSIGSCGFAGIDTCCGSGVFTADNLTADTSAAGARVSSVITECLSDASTDTGFARFASPSIESLAARVGLVTGPEAAFAGCESFDPFFLAGVTSDWSPAASASSDAVEVSDSAALVASPAGLVDGSSFVADADAQRCHQNLSTPPLLTMG